MARQASRTVTGGTAAVLFVLGLFFTRVLVADAGDNAYIYLALIGGALIAVAVPFALATLLPAGGARRALVRVALGLLVVVGVLGLALLVLSVVIIPSQDYESDTVLINHLVGLMALIALLIALAAVYRRLPR